MTTSEAAELAAACIGVGAAPVTGATHSRPMTHATTTAIRRISITPMLLARAAHGCPGALLYGPRRPERSAEPGQDLPQGVDEPLVVGRVADGDAQVVGGETGEGVAGAHGHAACGQARPHGRAVGDPQQQEVRGRRPDALWRPLSSGR